MCISVDKTSVLNYAEISMIDGGGPSPHELFNAGDSEAGVSIEPIKRASFGAERIALGTAQPPIELRTPSRFEFLLTQYLSTQQPGVLARPTIQEVDQDLAAMGGFLGLMRGVLAVGLGAAFPELNPSNYWASATAPGGTVDWMLKSMQSRAVTPDTILGPMKV